ncbi:DUF2513 domain-containing protein [Lentibacter sp. XHP0401]|uniref:DUF2513 domain-containing protein n=1 Tax=Lentibacter sp. XHP0401 TaxID=2984334 RepID=UPI0021E78BA2|nr:DUF2513 domain-containing protein [Lentibacter sp. XHP0401]MCV2893742.1 DUF2513 domain-containing protein [Lentibacter sp. XHP0401]
MRNTACGRGSNWGDGLVRRDLDRIRHILLRCEAATASKHILADFCIQDRYQINMMAEAGLVDLDNPSSGPYQFRPEAIDHLAIPRRLATFEITWEGHDYLEAVRDGLAWEKTQKAVVASGGGATLGIVKSLALGFLKERLKGQTGISV